MRPPLSHLTATITGSVHTVSNTWEATREVLDIRQKSWKYGNFERTLHRECHRPAFEKQMSNKASSVVLLVTTLPFLAIIDGRYAIVFQILFFVIFTTFAMMIFFKKD